MNSTKVINFRKETNLKRAFAGLSFYRLSNMEQTPKKSMTAAERKYLQRQRQKETDPDYQKKENERLRMLRRKQHAQMDSSDLNEKRKKDRLRQALHRGKKKLKLCMVEKTNDRSIVCKASLAERKYFNDPFVSHFVPKPSRKSSVVHRGYYVRAKAVDFAFQSFFDAVGSCEQSQVISLGAGFDTSYFRLKSNNCLPDSTRYFEVDFSSVVETKKSVIINHETLLELVGEFEGQRELEAPGLYGEQYKLITSDLSCLSSLEANLTKVGVDFRIPTLLLSECVIMYMDVDHCSDLIKWAADKFLSACFVSYETFSPDDGFGIFMQNHFVKIKSPLKSICHYRTIEAQKQRYLSLGWENSHVSDMSTFYFNKLSKQEKLRIRNIELYDEFEEFQLACLHYVLSIASNGSLLNSACLNMPEPDTRYYDQERDTVSWISYQTSRTQRYGHTSNLMNGKIITIGGFGRCANGPDKRLTTIDTFHYDMDKISLANSTEDVNSEMLFHQATATTDGKIIITGGRKSPANGFSESRALDLSTIVEFKSNVSSDGHLPARWRHSASMVVAQDNNEVLIVFGGLTNGYTVLGDVWMFDVKTKIWKEMETSSQFVGRHSHTSSVWQRHKVIITGGMDSEELPVECTQIYDFWTNSWSTPEVNGLLPRYSHTSCVVDDKLILVGGVNAYLGSSPGLAVIDLLTFNCREYNLPLQNPEVPFTLIKHSMVVKDKKLVIIGGGGNYFTFGSNFNPYILVIDCINYFG